MIKCTPELTVYDFETKEDRIIVDLYGGPDNAFGAVTFTFSSARDRDRSADSLKRWQAEGRLVDLMQVEDQIVLRPR